MPYINGNEVFIATDIINSQDSSGGFVEIVDDLTSYDTDKALSANQGRELAERITAHYSELTQEIEGNTAPTVFYPSVKAVTDYVTNYVDTNASGGSSVEVVDNLESEDTNKALSANMGKVLNERKLDKDIVLYEFVSPNLLNLETLNIGYFLANTGGLQSNASYITSDYIPVESGDTVRYQFNYASNRFDNTEKPTFTSFTICAYDENKVFIDNSYLTGAKSYMCPNGSKFVRVQFSKGSFNAGNFSDCAIVISDSAEVIPFYPYGLTERHIKTEILPAGDNGNKVIQNSNNEASIEIDVPQLKKNKTIGFMGLFNAFEPLYIYQGKGTGFTETYCKIDETNLQVYQKGNETPILDVVHGLTIVNYISVVISTENKNKTIIYISSNGQSFTSTSTTWFSSRDKIVAEHGTTAWDNTLTFGSKDFGERVWLYGDSYFDHWVPILLDRGYTSFLCDGYSGGTSLNGAKSFELALTMGTPAKVVWCLGMNDPDENRVNANWQTAINKVKNLCDVYGIELVVCTIPYVPEREHKHKNAHIRDVAKFNYIDISRFVGSQRNGNSTGVDWYDGLLSDDNVHPSAQGDYYIANIMQSYLPDLRNS